MDSTIRPLVIAWLLAVLAGTGIGFFIAQYVSPLSYTDAQPYDLGAAIQDDYLRMIASSYVIDNSFELANRRVYYLQLDDPRRRLEQLAATETNALTQQALLKLLLDLDRPSVARARATSTPRPTRDLTPLPRITVIVLEPTAPLPTAPPVTLAPSPIPPTTEPNPNAPPFDLVEQRALDCTAMGGGTALRIEVRDAHGRGLPGIVVEVNSAMGNEQFFTGLKPELGAGYADVSLVPGVYSVHLVENASSPVVGDLRINPNLVECGSNPTATQGWYLVFQARTN